MAIVLSLIQTTILLEHINTMKSCVTIADKLNWKIDSLTKLVKSTRKTLALSWLPEEHNLIWMFIMSMRYKHIYINLIHFSSHSI